MRTVTVTAPGTRASAAYDPSAGRPPAPARRPPRAPAPARAATPRRACRARAAPSPQTAVRGHRVVRREQPEQRRAHGQAAPGPHGGRAPQRADVERVVEHPGVAVQRGHGRRRPQLGVARHLRVLLRDSPSAARAAAASPASFDELVDQLRPQRRSARGGRGASSRRGGPSPPPRFVSDGGSSTSTARTVAPWRLNVVGCRPRVLVVYCTVPAAITVALVTRRHVDHLRVASAACRPGR